MPAPTYEYLVEATLGIDATGAASTVYFSTHGRTTGPFDSPANTWYEPRIIQPGTIQLDLYNAGTTRGRSRYSFGAIVLANADGGLDAMLDYGYAGRSITVLMGEVGEPRSSFVTVFTGTMDQPSFEWQRLTLRVRDLQYVIEQAKLQSTIYGGTNSGSPLAGIDGTASDIKGKSSPIVYGKVSNIAGYCVNTDKYVFQVSDVALSAVDAVYDAGKTLTAGSTYSSQSDMETNAPSAGGYRVWLAGGCIRLGTKPGGTITADVTQGSSSAQRTAAQLLKTVALRAGLASGSISATDVTALDTLTSAECGVYIDGGEQTLSVMDRIANSVGAWFGFDLSGVLRMGRITAPAGTPAITLDGTNIVAIDRVASSDQGGGVPAWRVTLNYWPALTRQSSGLDASLATARKEYLETGSRAAVASDSTVLLKHPGAAALVFDTVMTTEADALAEASRLLALYKVRRDRLRVTIVATPVIASSLVLGSIVQVTLPRFDLTSGKSFVLTGMTSDFSRNSVVLDLWG